MRRYLEPAVMERFAQRVFSEITGPAATLKHERFGSPVGQLRERLEDLDALLWQREDVILSRLHASARYGPGRGVQVDFLPLCSAKREITQAGVQHQHHRRPRD